MRHGPLLGLKLDDDLGTAWNRASGLQLKRKKDEQMFIRKLKNNQSQRNRWKGVGWGGMRGGGEEMLISDETESKNS